MKSIGSVLLAQPMIPFIEVLIILVLLLVTDANVPFVLLSSAMRDQISQA